MKVVVIVFVLAVLAVTLVDHLNTETVYRIRCVAEGLIMYDGMGTDLEQHTDEIIFRDLSGDKVSIVDAQCVVKKLD